MELLPLFASNVFKLTIEEDTDSLLGEQSFSNSVEQDRQESVYSVGCLDKANHNIRVLDRHPEIAQILLNKWMIIAKDVLNYDCNFVLTTSWITKNYKGMNSQEHHHKNSFYSGIFYFDDYDENVGRLVFGSPLANFPDFLIEPSKYHLHNSPAWVHIPKAKELILFPSYLNHQVLPHGSDKPRKSLAFNIVPTGIYGIGDSKLDTKWLS